MKTQVFFAENCDHSFDPRLEHNAEFFMTQLVGGETFFLFKELALEIF
jgi:hypothetical protein